MIRQSPSEDMASILALWMKRTIYAHPFIEERYWHESEAIVRHVYLPAAQTWAWEENRQLKGFVSVLEARFVGALLVAPDPLMHGIGKTVVGNARQRFPPLRLGGCHKN
ncbi:N-acetyltransferase, partial [Salmonella enterica]|uniref:N-acetyltransferase n=1 Tax=Salmonella enterica TaxID=28901 RepID=UPI0007757CCA